MSDKGKWACFGCGVERSIIHAQCMNDKLETFCAACAQKFTDGSIRKIDNAMVSQGLDGRARIGDMTHEEAVLHERNLRETLVKSLSFLVAEYRSALSNHDVEHAEKTLARIESWLVVDRGGTTVRDREGKLIAVSNEAVTRQEDGTFCFSGRSS